MRVLIGGQPLPSDPHPVSACVPTAPNNGHLENLPCNRATCVQRNFGAMGDGESDTFKRVLIEGNPYFLGLTFSVSLLHSLFDVLAFKNDIGFWRGKKNVEGLSVRTILLNCFCQARPCHASEQSGWRPQLVLGPWVLCVRHLFTSLGFWPLKLCMAPGGARRMWRNCLCAPSCSLASACAPCPAQLLLPGVLSQRKEAASAQTGRCY